MTALRAAALLLAVARLLIAAPALAADVSGTVYEDLDRNGALDAGEPAPGLTLYAKLVVPGSATADQVVAVSAVDGSYSLLGVPPGSYDVRIDDSVDPGDVTPNLPGTWGFISPFLGSQSVTVAATNLVGVDFGVEAAPPCRCGFGDGLFTELTITPDGIVNEWAPVVADGDNVSCDATGLTDRDHPVQSTGRDLVQFAVTWNSSNLFTLTRRVGSSANTIKFIYYADVDADGLMETGEPVIVARWSGNTQLVELYYGTYQPVAAGGDPLVDGQGFGDGYTMPGQILNLPPPGTPDSSGFTASADGRAMEWAVPWSVLGVSPGSAIGWHVAATNTEPSSASFPAQTDDNLAGCGGCSGSNQFAGLTFEPDRSTLVVAGATAVTAHQLTNTGNGTDTFDLASTATGPVAPTGYGYYQDLGTVGTFEPGTDPPLTDSDGDGVVDTGALAAGTAIDLLVATDTPAGAAGDAIVTTTATSSFLAACGVAAPTTAAVTDTIEVVQPLSGHVYEDADHDALRDAGEAGTGLALWAKLVPTASPTGPASQAVSVDPATGAFVIAAAPGSYFLVIDDDADPADVTPASIAGWLGTEEADLQRDGLTVGAGPLTGQDFGLYHGSRLDGIVFSDDGSGGGGAGNGLRDGSEPGIAGVLVEAQAGACTGPCASTVSDGAGGFTLWLPASVDGAAVAIVERNLAGHVSTGGSPGDTGGSYDLALDAIDFTNVGGTSYAGLAFGDLSASRFSPDHQGRALPGSAAFYRHTFLAVADGTVRFATLSTPSPAIAGWLHAVHHDVDCNGTLDASEPVLQSTDGVPVSAGQPLCLIVRESVPPTAPSGAQDLVVVTASFTPDQASSPQLLEVRDLTTVGAPTGGALTLVKSVDRASALPSEVLVYTVTYTNQGTSPISNLVVYDATPAFTTYVGGSAVCGPLPANLTACTPIAPADGAAGPLEWAFTGTLSPGQTGSVEYSVRID